MVVTQHLHTSCGGDWRRVVVRQDGSLVVVNQPQTRRVEVAPATILRGVRRPRKQVVVEDLSPPTCPRPDKKIYPTRADAEEWQAHTIKHGDEGLEAYHCVCGFWHLGHPRRSGQVAG
jgi:hypothetical protein